MSPPPAVPYDPPGQPLVVADTGSPWKASTARRSISREHATATAARSTSARRCARPTTCRSTSSPTAAGSTWRTAPTSRACSRRRSSASRLRYTFNSKSFLRLIGQREARTQDPALYGFIPPVPAKSVALDYSALFAYKLNWQSVLFFGYQEQSAWSESTTDVEIAGRSLFLKISYAFQR
jgi:hypothetical protein